MLDSDLQLELRARFNPDGSELRRIQLRQLEILKYVDGICKKNGIPYWLSSGTLLGAVRHGGFIPWDDDVDIEMLKEDFNKLCHILEHSVSDDYVLQTHNTDPEYFAPYAKLRDIHSFINEINSNDIWYKYKGLYIDIFAIERSNSYIVSNLRHNLRYF